LVPGLVPVWGRPWGQPRALALWLGQLWELGLGQELVPGLGLMWGLQWEQLRVHVLGLVWQAVLGLVSAPG